MKRLHTILAALSLAVAAQAQIGEPYIHDPSTLAECDGKYYTFGTGGGGLYYTFGTGGGGLISEDGWSWHSGADRPGGGAAPDVLKIGDRYLCIYGATGGGLGGGHAGRILTMWNKTLDPQSPDFKWSEAVEVCYSDGMEDQDAIDPGLLLDPTTGRLWVSYGTYFGTIRCEASDLMYRDGWYYLLGTHGTCCDGVNSTYNIVVGRSKSVEGPYLDNVGRDMFHGGGKMVIAAEDRACGAGHFGRYIIDEGVEVMSFHWEADFELSGRSVLAVRPLVWKNGWPVAGEHFKGGTFEIESERRGYALELAVDFVRIPQERQGWFNREQMQQPPRIGDYMHRPHQRWTVTPVNEAGGYLSNPYFRITIEGTDRALAATADCEVTTVPAYTGDGTFRIMPKAIPGQAGVNTSICLYSAGDSTPTLAQYDFNSDNSKWNFRNH